ncbi:MAG: hypothetical protein R3208_11695 [Ketobacteraceae bacterium]|nr:hypothetical protein [Ketobacteraceae bacterium]
MSISLSTILNHTVIVGLSYFDSEGNLVSQRQLGGVVIETDQEKGIAIKRHGGSDQYFVLPASLLCWFHAPRGHFYDSESGALIENPDFLVTWDVFQQQEDVDEGNHQWWEWRPRTTPPQVAGNQ